MSIPNQNIHQPPFPSLGNRKTFANKPANNERGKVVSKATKGNSFSLSPIHERYRVFKEAYNESRSDVKQKIRLTRDSVVNKLLYAYYNQFYTLEIKHWEDKNPELLPALKLNNVDLAKKVGVEAKSTAWRALDFLCKIDLGEGRGLFMKKIFRGFYQDYSLLINPWILTGQKIENWGTTEEKKWQKTSPIKPVEVLHEKPLVANCNLPFNLKNKTNTYPCGKVETVQPEQEQGTGTKGDSINPYLKARMSGIQRLQITEWAAGDQNISSARAEQIKKNLLGVGNAKEQGKERLKEGNTVDKPMEKPHSSPLRQLSFQLTRDFYDFAIPILYPKHIHTCKKQKKTILKTIWLDWFKKYVVHPDCSEQYLEKYFEFLKELIVITQQELDKKPDSYVHGNPAIFFSREFQHGLVRAETMAKKKRYNKDISLLKKAQKSISTGKIPKTIKNIHSLIDLVAYWKYHIQQCTTNQAIVMKAFNQFLAQPKNLPKNALK